MKKAIVVVSFGTSYLDTLEKTIRNVEKKIKGEFLDYKVYRAFTSHKIIKKLDKKYNIKVEKLEEVLDKLYINGVEEVIVQPLHIIPGEEYNYVKNITMSYRDKFKNLKLGRPIFYYEGIEDLPDDYSLFVKSMENVFKDNNPVVMVGHGTANPSNAVYGCLQTVLENEGYENVFIGTVEGYPTFNNVLKRINKKNIKEITIMPLMLVAGDHAINDIGSNDEDSWKSRFEAEGIKVNVLLKGLGEFEEFVALYSNRIDDLINNRYIGVGETKKGHRNEIISNCI